MKALLFVLLLTFGPSLAGATLDIRFGGGYGTGVGDNSGLPKLDGDDSMDFEMWSYNLDVVLSEYWLIIGARADVHNTRTGDQFYFDTPANQYTKFGVKTEHRVYSGILGFHYELNTSQTDEKGVESVYSANIFFVIPFAKNNHVEIESNNALGLTRVTGEAQQDDFYAVYLEGNRAVKGGFTLGLQIGYIYHKLKDIRDSNNAVINDQSGSPLELNLSNMDFRMFFGVRF